MRFLSLLAALALAGPAFADDLPAAKTPPAPPAPLPVWTGWYGGAQVGLALGSTTYRQPATAYQLNWDNNGVIGGLHFGYAYQIDRFVLGLQVQGDALSVAGAGSDSLAFSPNILRVSSHNDWIVSIDGRAGALARPDLLLYVIGGYAIADVQSSVQRNGVQIGQLSTSVNGFDIGAGAEYLFSPHWSGKLEYRYYAFQPHNAVFDVAPYTLFRENVNFQTARAGVSYHWFPDPAPAVVAAKY